MKKLIFPLLLLTLAFIESNAQVKFSLSLLSDQETYLVSLLPEKAIPTPMNMASNIQVVLKVPLDKPFIAGEITSQIAGIDWVDNAILNQAHNGENYALCAFAMVQSSTKNISFEAGTELPLFTFKNLETGCVGSIQLPENGDTEVNKAVARGFNFTQNITLLASRGNAFTGVINKIADCEVLSTSVSDQQMVNSLKAYPVPTNKVLHIEWVNPTTFDALQLQLINASGQLLQTLAVDPQQGAKKIQLEVGDYSAGLYNFQLKNNEGGLQQFKFIVTNQR